MAHRAAEHPRVARRSCAARHAPCRPTPRRRGSPCCPPGTAGRPRAPARRGRRRRGCGSGGCSRACAERSLATTITSLATPASSHILAVSIAALPDAHIAVTFMTGPWKSWRCHQQRQHRRRHEVEVLVALQPAVALHVELAPEVDLAEHDRVDHADDRPGPPAPVERVLDRLVGGLRHGRAEAGQAVGALDLGDDRAVGDVVAEPLLVARPGQDRGLAAAQAVPQVLATPAVAGDGAEPTDRDPSPRCVHRTSPRSLRPGRKANSTCWTPRKERGR